MRRHVQSCITRNYVVTATVLDSQQVVSDIALCFDKCHIAGLGGPPGCGKSVTANSLGAHWEQRAGAATIAAGDDYQKARRYFPFHQAITKFDVERDFITKTASGALAKSASAIPIAGPLASYVIEKMFVRSQVIAKEKYPFLNSEEQSILYGLQKIAGKRRLLLICDDLQAWDESSLSLLRLILSGKLNEVYTYLNEARFLLIQTLQTEEPSTFETLIPTINSVPIWRLRYVSRSEFPAVLRLLGSNRELPLDLLDGIFSICGGHLQLTRQLVQYLEIENASLGSQWIADSESQLIFRLIQDRLKAFGAPGIELLAMLQAASTIGQIFSDYELACLVNRDVHQIRDLLERAEALQFFRRRQRYIYFAHGILLDGLRQANKVGARTQHRQFADCLKKIRPGDYRSRSYHLQSAGDHEDAAILAACSQLFDQRRGVSFVDDEEERQTRGAGISATVDTLKNAYNLAQRYDLDEALKLLSHVDPTTPTMLIAEASYIRAMCLIKRYQYDARDEAIALVDTWAQKLADEDELVTRLLSTQLVALAHQRDQRRALEAEAKLIERLRKRISFDSDALDALFILDRKADLLYSADQAYHRLLRAKEYFMPLADGQPRNFYQYCTATINLAANCIMCANYVEALDHLREITAFLDKNPGQFLRLEVLTNNVIVAEFRSGGYSAEAAATFFDSLVQEVVASMDYALELSNCGALWALAGNLSRAREILEPLYRNLAENLQADDYHEYFVGSNLASVLFLLGDKEQAIQIFSDLEKILDSVNPPHTAYFRARHEILDRTIRQGRNITPQEWDRSPVEIEPVGAGPGWMHYGRGLLLTDLQIWTES